MELRPLLGDVGHGLARCRSSQVIYLELWRDPFDPPPHTLGVSFGTPVDMYPNWWCPFRDTMRSSSNAMSLAVFALVSLARLAPQRSPFVVTKSTFPQ